jgi:6-phosphogluconolactonase
MTRPEPRIEIVADATALVALAVERVTEKLAAAVAARGRARLALSGGTTPRKLFRRLASDSRPRVDWRRVVVFWGDEREVPPDHPDSNYGTARASGLLERIPSRQIHRWATERGPEEAATLYEEELAREFALPAGQVPRFDLVLLGIGADGHTASLFPGTPALGERERLAMANPVEALGAVRLTLTFPVLEAARAVVLLASGAEKAEAVARAFGGWAAEVPAGRVRPREGTLDVLLDAEAASLLPPDARG